MPHASVWTKPQKAKAHVVNINVGESVITVHKGDSAVQKELGKKIATAMRRRKSKPGVETASEGLHAIRERR